MARIPNYIILGSCISILLAAAAFGFGAFSALAQTSAGVSYIPLIGITAVPDPLALPNGAGKVTYRYAVKNLFGNEPLTNVQVVDDSCSPITLVSGDTNNNGALDAGETWFYECTTTVSKTTLSTATASGSASGITATDQAHTTVVVGSPTLPPLVSIVDISKVAYPLSLPEGGGPVTFMYKVTNPGVVPLSDVVVTDDACSTMSGELGDTNGNGLLDTSEVWIYTCTTILRQTTTNTATVTASADGLNATDDDTITVAVATSSGELASSGVPGFPDNGPNPNLPDNGLNPDTLNVTVVIWSVLGGILLVLLLVFVLTRKK